MVRLDASRFRRDAARLGAALLAAGAVLVAATAAGTRPAHARPAGHVFEDGIVYGEADGHELALDLCRPADGEGPFPGLVLIHGGGWKGGDRASFRGLAAQAAERGFVAVTVSYRLTNVLRDDGSVRWPFPAAVHDVKAAVRWLRKNADRYGVSPDRIGAMGGSAGGHLSLMLGVTDPDDGLEGESGTPDVSSRVHAVVNFFGPTDMKRGWETTIPSGKSLLDTFLGGTPATAAEAYRRSSPVTFVDAGDAPTLTVHGDRDPLVPVEQARILDAAMEEAGVHHELHVVEGGGHGFGGLDARRALERSWAFLGHHLKKKRRVY